MSDLTTPGAVRRAWIEAMDGASPAKTAPAPAAAPSLAERVARLEELRGGCPGCGATPDDDDVCVCDCAVHVEEGRR